VMVTKVSIIERVSSNFLNMGAAQLLAPSVAMRRIRTLAIIR
jgi:hypothetical protein